MEVWTYTPGAAQWDRGPDFPVFFAESLDWLARRGLAFLLSRFRVSESAAAQCAELAALWVAQTGQAWGGCASYQGRLIAISGSHGVYPSVGVFDPRVWCLKE